MKQYRKASPKKTVQKSIRISEEVARYIDKQEGNGFNEKFCNMVLYCMEHEAEINKRVRVAEEQLEFLEKKLNEKEDILIKLENLSHFVNSCLRVIQ